MCKNNKLEVCISTGILGDRNEKLQVQVAFLRYVMLAGELQNSQD